MGILRPMEFSIKFDTVKLEWSIVYIEGIQVVFQKLLKKKISEDFVLANSTDPGEMQLYATFHQSLHCLPKYLFRDSQSSKDYGLMKIMCHETVTFCVHKSMCVHYVEKILLL